jgi:hypothetical protein
MCSTTFSQLTLAFECLYNLGCQKARFSPSKPVHTGLNLPLDLADITKIPKVYVKEERNNQIFTFEKEHSAPRSLSLLYLTPTIRTKSQFPCTSLSQSSYSSTTEVTEALLVSRSPSAPVARSSVPSDMLRDSSDNNLDKPCHPKQNRSRIHQVSPSIPLLSLLRHCETKCKAVHTHRSQARYSEMKNTVPAICCRAVQA